EEPPGTRIDLDLSVAMFDAAWRHVATCDDASLLIGERAAVHSGDQTSAAPPLGASEFIDLDVDRLRALGVRHAVMMVLSYDTVPFERLSYGFAGVMRSPADGEPPEPRAAAQRFDLHGWSAITVPFALDLEARRASWLDVHITGFGALHAAGGYRAALAHLGRD